MNSEVQELELNIEDAKKRLDYSHALERLSNNPDFKKIVQDGYFVDEAVRLVHLKSDANMQDERQQKNLERDIMAIGSFRQYLDRIHRDAEGVQEAIDECEDALTEARAGEIE